MCYVQFCIFFYTSSLSFCLCHCLYLPLCLPHYTQCHTPHTHTRIQPHMHTWVGGGERSSSISLLLVVISTLLGDSVGKKIISCEVFCKCKTIKINITPKNSLSPRAQAGWPLKGLSFQGSLPKEAGVWLCGQVAGWETASLGCVYVQGLSQARLCSELLIPSPWLVSKLVSTADDRELKGKGCCLGPQASQTTSCPPPLFFPFSTFPLFPPHLGSLPGEILLFLQNLPLFPRQLLLKALGV